MKACSRIAIALIACSLCIPAFSQSQETQARITNYVAPGNLQSNHPLECISSDQAKNIYTPADLYKAVAKCMNADKFKEGLYLYALAGVYGRFDTLRVSDSTAHQALLVLQMQEFDGIAESRKDRLMEEAKKMAGDKNELNSTCSKIRELGPPNYHPDYMIQHGMSAFTGGHGDGLAPNFDSKASWEKSLDTYLHCPSPATQLR